MAAGSIMPRLKFIVAGGLIVGAIAYLMLSGINQSLVYYYTVSEFLKQTTLPVDRGVRVSGRVLAGSIQRDASLAKVTFVAIDRQTHQSLPVTYQGIVPDTFKDEAEVVVEGIYHPDEGLFQATTLLAKCPSKYEELVYDDSEGSPVQREALE